jgi:hypothetical protein
VASLDSPERVGVWERRAFELLERIGQDEDTYLQLAIALGSVGRDLDAMEAAAQVKTFNSTVQMLVVSLTAAVGNVVPAFAMYDMACGRQIRPAYRGRDPTNVRALAPRLRDDQVVLMLGVGVRGIFGISLFKDSEPVFMELVSACHVDELREACMGFAGFEFFPLKRYRGMGRSRYGDGHYQTLQLVWEKLIAPMLGERMGSTTGIDLLPVGWLAGIPWHAVGADPRNGDCLLGRISVSILPGLWFHDTDHQATQSRSELVFVHGDYSGDIRDTCEAEEQFFSSKGFRVVQERSEVVKAFSIAKVVHFCGHGEFQKGKQGSLPSLLLHDQGRLSIEELLSQGDLSPLVTLSACELGSTMQSEGNLFGMPGFLMMKNTRAVVAFGSCLDTRVASQFFPAFYEALLGGATIGESARVGLSLQKIGSGGVRDLGLWAPLTIYGDQWSALDDF